MLVILTTIIKYISHTQSIDSENPESLKVSEVFIDHLNIPLHTNIPEEMKDFDYRTTPLDYLINKRMPYINCNRSIF